MSTTAHSLLVKMLTKNKFHHQQHFHRQTQNKNHALAVAQ